ncbi:unnamed protein product, partial [Musa acuminata subsp. burmannicoides]
MHLLAAYELYLLLLVVTLLPVATPMPPVGAALRNVGRLPYIPIRFGFLLFLFISGKLLQALAVAGKEATSEVHLLAAYVVWLLMLVVTLMPVVIPRPPLEGRVALLIPPVVVRARGALRNVGRLPYIPRRFGFLLFLFISGKLLQALAVAGKEANSEVH